MIRTQILITKEQSQKLKTLASSQGISVSELIRRYIDWIISASNPPDQEDLRLAAMQAAGKIRGPNNLAEDHDPYLEEAYQS
ncbi:MAG TPA: hypothetical protein VLM80_03475 [Anaerolineales bacterium]|nr:hypothetical protein [Anaerolineales bacterium]